jgi:hypothetical protein
VLPYDEMIEIREYIDRKGSSPFAKEKGELKVALTRNFKETIKDRVERDSAFREELLKEGVEYLLTGDVDTGKAILRDYINATIGFNALGSLTDKSPKSLMRMLGPNGNPQARNLFEIIARLQKREGIQFEVRTVRWNQYRSIFVYC